MHQPGGDCHERWEPAVEQALHHRCHRGTGMDRECWVKKDAGAWNMQQGWVRAWGLGGTGLGALGGSWVCCSAWSRPGTRQSRPSVNTNAGFMFCSDATELGEEFGARGCRGQGLSASRHGHRHPQAPGAAASQD
eukprot:1136615-Pelagomonas_calceolata.AAC.5